MPKQAWNIFIGFLMLAVIGFLGYTAWKYRDELSKVRLEMSSLKNDKTQASSKGEALQEELSSVQQDAQTMKENLKKTMATIERLEIEKTTLQEENSRLQEEKEKVAVLKDELEQEMRSELQNKDVTISELQGKLEVNILNRILFDSGRAELKDEGKKVLQDVATVLEAYPNRQIHVVGHTDNVPFTGRGGRFNNNWELSAGRAVSAVAFLQNDAGVNPKRLAAVGYSEYHPLSDNSTSEGRAQNRRITLVIMPETLKVVPPEPLPAAKPEMTQEPTEETEPDKTTEEVPPTSPTVEETVKPKEVILPPPPPLKSSSTNNASPIPSLPAPKADRISTTTPQG